MARFAAETTVPVEQTRLDIEKLLAKHGATHFAYGTSPGQAQIGFTLSDRHIRFDLPLLQPASDEIVYTQHQHKRRSTGSQQAALNQSHRQRWRALLLAIKAKLETVELGISTFDSEFLAFIVNPSTGRTVGEELRPAITACYDQPEAKRPLGLPGPSGP